MIIISILLFIALYLLALNRVERKIARRKHKEFMERIKEIDKVEPRTLTGGLHHDRKHMKNGRKNT